MKEFRLLVSVLVLQTLTMLAVPGRAAPVDLFAPRAAVDGDTALYLDAASGRAANVERLRARLKQRPAPANAYEGWSFLCDLDFHRAQYGSAIAECEQAIAANPRGGDANTLTLIRLLADQPPPRARGAARVAVTPGEYVPVTAGAYDGRAMADTGAQISVMMQSVARAAGVKVLGTSGQVNSPTGPVTGQIGMLPQVKIGGAVLENLPVLIMPDAQLTFSGGKETVSLPFILSVYALVAFGRVAWLDHDQWLALGSAAPKPLAGAVPLVWHPAGIAVPLTGALGRRAAQFDSGDDQSYLYDTGVELLSEAERASIAKAVRTAGSVGGVTEAQVRRVPQAQLRLAGQPLVLRNTHIVTANATGEAARLGEDVLKAYSAVVFDFDAMSFSVLP